jgi:putative acetyltransferase
MNEMTVREFSKGTSGSDAEAFRRLNEEWITRYFVLEKKDVEALSDPEGTILAAGGRIFFAVREGEIVGCCALMAMGNAEFEVAKMAVTEKAQGSGIGRRLLETVVAEARMAGARRLYLETNSKLTPAIRLYESVGFRDVPSERVVASPYARANVYMEISLGEEKHEWATDRRG